MQAQGETWCKHKMGDLTVMTFSTVFEPGFLAEAAQRAARAQTEERWKPAIDLAEDEQSFYVVADLPGVSPEDIDLQINEGCLTLTGERKTGKFKNTTRLERHNGPFTRSFTLPETADAEAISAKHELGVLEITIPKQAKPAPRRIPVRH